MKRATSTMLVPATDTVTSPPRTALLPGILLPVIFWASMVSTRSVPNDPNRIPCRQLSKDRSWIRHRRNCPVDETPSPTTLTAWTVATLAFLISFWMMLRLRFAKQ